MDVAILLMGVAAGWGLCALFNSGLPDPIQAVDAVDRVREEQRAIRDANAAIFDISCPDDMDQFVIDAMGQVASGWEWRVSKESDDE